VLRRRAPRVLLQWQAHLRVLSQARVKRRVVHLLELLVEVGQLPREPALLHVEVEQLALELLELLPRRAGAAPAGGHPASRGVASQVCLRRGKEARVMPTWPRPSPRA